MGTDKRARQKAGRATRLQAEYDSQQSQRRRRSTIRIVLITALIILVVVLWSIFTGDDPETIATDSTATTVTTATTETTTAPTTTAGPTTTLGAAGPGDCPAEDGSSPQQTQFETEHPLCIDPAQKYVAEFSTSVGDFEVVIDPAIDEASANNFVTLARYHAYDGTIFHRIISGFVVQGGDVAGLNGGGDPGYKFTGLRPQPGQYRIGSIAMANNGSNPETNGSQFFIITGQSGVALSPNFSLFGQVISGLDVPIAMQDVETGPGDQPIVDVVVTALNIRIASAEDVSAYEAAISQ